MRFFIVFLFFAVVCATTLGDTEIKESEDVGGEGQEFLRPYKEDLGTLWDQLKNSVKKILSQDQ